jgi:hypothetical protein
MKVVAISVTLVSILVALGMVVGAWQLSAARKAKVAVNRDTEYRRLAEEYRRLADNAVTSQEHTDLKLGEINTRITLLADQLESIQRILKDVE